MKIAINICYGGFSLSVEAIYELIKRNSKCLEKILIESINDDPSFISEFSDYKENIKQHRYMLSLVLVDEKVIYKLIDTQDTRFNSDLIEVVEKLKENANGCYANISIIEISDNIEWQIKDNYGFEYIAEKHKTRH